MAVRVRGSRADPGGVPRVSRRGWGVPACSCGDHRRAGRGGVIIRRRVSRGPRRVVRHGGDGFDRARDERGRRRGGEGTPSVSPAPETGVLFKRLRRSGRGAGARGGGSVRAGGATLEGSEREKACGTCCGRSSRGPPDEARGAGDGRREHERGWMFRAERRGSRIPKPLVSSHAWVFDGRGSNLEPSTPSTRCAKNLKNSTLDSRCTNFSNHRVTVARSGRSVVYRELVRRSCQILAVGGGRREDVLPREAALAIERKGWRKDHPHGFVAKPGPRWRRLAPAAALGVQGAPKGGHALGGGLYPVVLEFSEDYPSKPPGSLSPPGFSTPTCTRAARCA